MTTEDSRARLALAAIRVLVSGLIAAHGWARLLTGAVAPFGAWLDDLGLPLGPWIAWGITALEIAGTPVLALGKKVPHLSFVYAVLYLVGLVLVHAPEGWFVVGLGRNGMEYSVLLVACLLAVGFESVSRRRSGLR